MIPKDVHKIIRHLQEHADQLSENQRRFVDQMVARLNKYGDGFYCSWRQRMYLSGLYSKLSKTELEKPKSRLDELKERKRKLLAKVGQQRRSKDRATELDVRGIPIVLGNIAANPVNVKMRHDKSVRQRQSERTKRTKKG
jgi:hypothetical protein